MWHSDRIINAKMALERGEAWHTKQKRVDTTNSASPSMLFILLLTVEGRITTIKAAKKNIV